METNKIEARRKDVEHREVDTAVGSAGRRRKHTPALYMRAEHEVGHPNVVRIHCA